MKKRMQGIRPWSGSRWLLLLGTLGAALLVAATLPKADEPDFVTLHAERETEPVFSEGDAADDPAIWFNAAAPEESRVLGTDKQRGLEVYDMQGQRLQTLSLGRLNNVDLRQGVLIDGERRDIAVATHVDDGSLAVFDIDDTGQVALLGSVDTELEDIYGLCLFAPADGGLDVFANAKDGRYLHFALAVDDDSPHLETLRYFRLDSTPEGCVVDDRHARLFVGEEHGGVWVMAAAADADTSRELIISADAPLKPDVEGLALYGDDYLLLSSQGNDLFAVIDAQPPYALRGLFRIEANPERGIGGVRDTDGLEVSDRNFGPGFERGLVVVQDGENQPRRQNFKYLSWASIAEALTLDEAAP